MPIFNSMPTIKLPRRPLSTTKSLWLFFLLSAAGCGAFGERPLSIKMHNPDTNVTLNCAARDTGTQNRDVLADTVETCARQLESRGFVRAGTAD